MPLGRRVRPRTPAGPGAPRSRACALALAALLVPAWAGAFTLHRLTLDLRDAAMNPIDARVSVRSDTTMSYYPAAPDTTLMAHDGYCYPTPACAIVVPEGPVTLSVSRGPEWAPLTRTFRLVSDTTLTVRLNRFLDMRARGFFSSDLHVHSQHPPIDFPVSPVNARRIARAEDLAILHLLDGDYRFTGVEDPTSDANTVIYYSFEHRHMTYGHVALPGLKTAVPWGCCSATARPS